MFLLQAQGPFLTSHCGVLRLLLLTLARKKLLSTAGTTSRVRKDEKISSCAFFFFMFKKSYDLRSENISKIRQGKVVISTVLPFSSHVSCLQGKSVWFKICPSIPSTCSIITHKYLNPYTGILVVRVYISGNLGIYHVCLYLAFLLFKIMHGGYLRCTDTD